MKLLYRITLRISVALLLLFAAWGTLFYYIIIDEINDETDDSLEDYSEYIITKALAGEQLPEKDNGTNNSYHITEVSEEYARTTPALRFLDETIYIYSKKETEPARTFKTIFRDAESRYYELTVMIPTIEKEDLQETILTWIVVLYFLMLASVVAVNAVVLRRSLRPLYVMLEWLDQLSFDREIPPLEMNTDITEFRRLSDSLMRSTRRNAEMYEQQSLFIGHASHELQTPVAIVSNRLELLAGDPALTEPQLEQIFKARRSLDDLARLNKTLLLLTRIENGRFPGSADVNVERVLRSFCSDFEEVYAHLEIACEIRQEASPVVRMDEMLASVFFGNLVKNAYLHNCTKGRVSVHIDGSGATIANTAVSGALNPEYIFRRFYQDSRREGSAGLGLSLVESIAKLYGIGIRYYFEEGMHYFRVEFPDPALVSL